MVDGNILISQVDDKGENEETLISAQKYNINPVLTRDEKFIVFRSSNRGPTRIWRADINGQNPKQLSDKDVGYVLDMESSPDAEFIYFTSQQSEGGKHNVMRIPINGGEATKLLPEVEESVSHLKFSPGGDMVAYRKSIYDSEAQKFISTVIIAGFDGREIGKKIKEFDMSIDSKFSWSKDGRSLTFMKKEGTDNLWSLDIRTGKQTQLTNIKSEFIPQFIWNNKGDQILVVEGKVINDLILIKSDVGK
jgi:Tol biopolymer transport system component